ncbi:MAG: YihY/virulence factor BrkB family protein [Lentisphaeria bacterium]|nr:YihY/virulence factor BrkB family protein [Lentisphaeria bacterium]
MQDTTSSRRSARARIEVLKTFVTDARRFFQEELWDRDVVGLPAMKRLLFSLCRVGAIVVKGFKADNCGLQASALTYITLMSMIPVLAMMFSFSKGIGMQNHLFEVLGLERLEVREVVDGVESMRVEFRLIEPPASDAAADHGGEPGSFLRNLPQPMQKVITTILSYVENTRFGTLGLVGSLLLMWAVVKAMSKLESSFNTIWGISATRPLFRKFTEYLFVLMILPVLFLAATSVNTVLSSPAMVGRIGVWFGPLAGLYQRMLRLSGIVLVVAAFGFLYKFMPNTKVALFPAAAAGLVGGVLWYVAQWAYITFQIGVTNYNAIYGTFAAVPFFLAWLYVNWTIVLFGAEVSFAVQNHRTYRSEGASREASLAARMMLGMIITHEACRAFLNGTGPWCPAQWARDHAIPARMAVGVVEKLLQAGVVVAVAGEAQKDPCVMPGRAVEKLSLADIEEAFRAKGEAYARRFVEFLPAPAAAAFEGSYNAFIGDLSRLSFRDILAQGEPG